ncbi:MAG: DUF4091 domain-containing protein [Planctomycetota bacterium]|nr:DUF4091 domain-containing protein [Planctomycetota bacterium]
MTAAPLLAWPVDEMTRVFPKDAPARDAARRARAGWQLWAARGEFVELHLGLSGAPKLADVTVEMSDLRPASRGASGAIPGRSARVRWVGLVPVPIDTFDALGAERPDEVPGWYPDPLLDAPPWMPPIRLSPDSPAGRLCAGMHVSFRVPRNAPPGAYRGHVGILLAGKVQARIPVTVTVWPFAIPRSPGFHVTNWFHLDCLTKHHRCEPWSERHWKLLDLYAQDMAEHRQSVISTPTLMGNFHNSDPMTLVDATLTRDGKWRFDMRRLARWVELFDRHGFELYEMWHLASQGRGDFAPPFCVTHEATGKKVWHHAMKTDSRAYRGLIAAFLREISAWLDRRDLTKRFLLHVFDEPIKADWPRYVELDRFFREHAPGLRHVDAISTSELITGHGAKIDIPVPLTYHLWDPDQYYKNRAAEGKEPVWWYTCSGPTGKYGNRFVCAPLIHTRILQWQAFAFGVSGYLHWGLNFWHRLGQSVSGRPGINGYADETLVNPMREHPTGWPVGDAAIVYPDPRWWEEHGPLGSLRWESMRAGLQDWELITSLAEAVEARKNQPGAGPALARARRVLAQIRGPIAGDLREYCRDTGKLLSIRRTVGDCLAALG